MPSIKKAGIFINPSRGGLKARKNLSDPIMVITTMIAKQTKTQQTKMTKTGSLPKRLTSPQSGAVQRRLTMINEVKRVKYLQDF